MKTYLVGGAVRDKLLGIASKDKDFVVVGSTPEEMTDKGFQAVGKDFPVFLHPTTKQEYALARTERKSGKGYKGFTCDASPDVTLEQDLLRRDLTINAMAMTENGDIIDPYGGEKDLRDGILRHVSPAFIEDPLRVLRVAKFAARFAHLNFAIHNDTLTLMRTISTSGELEALSAERVWQETSEALGGKQPSVYFSVLKSCDALSYWFKELDSLWGIPNPSEWHPEIDTGVHTMMVLQKAVEYSQNLAVRFAALTHDFGKSMTDITQWPSHHGHDDLGIPAIELFSQRLKVPNDCRDLAIITSQNHSVVHRLFEKPATEILNCFDQCDAWRKPERFEQFLKACQADFKGRKHFENRDYPQAKAMLEILRECQSIDVQTFVQQGLKGSDIRDALQGARLDKIESFLSKHK